MSFLKFKSLEPTPPPAAPGEVFKVPAECWQCKNRYECNTCPHGLKVPLVIGRRYGVKE